MLITIRSGVARMIHTDKLRLPGKRSIARASNVEPDANGRWTADMSPVGGPLLNNKGRGFSTRQAALDAELAWLNRNPQTWGINHRRKL